MIRRELLQGAFGLGVSVLATACRCTKPAVYETDWRELDRLSQLVRAPNPFLAPPAINVTHKLTQKVIDPHCHIYNASDWQIGGALEGPLAHSMQNELVRDLLKLIAGPFEEVASCIAISAKDELALVEGLAGIDPGEIELELQARADELERLIEEALYAMFSRGPATAKIREILQAEPRAFTGKPHKEFSETFLRDALAYSASIIKPIPTAGDTEMSGSANGLFGFLKQMLSPRYTNLMAYQAGFTSSEESLGIDGCYASLLDFDYWIGRKPHARSRLRDQMLLMERIAELSGGYMKPIIAYNPWTDINDSDASIDLLVDAVCNHGFVGVKIYPQMGYYPTGNATLEPPEGDEPRPTDLQLLDRKLEHFFEVCRDLSIPVMTHGNDSMGRNLSHNKLGGWRAWKLFFEEPANAGTRVNLGHMGGETGGATGNENWTEKFVSEVMSLPGASHLYGDFGLWKGMMNPGDAPVDRIRDLLDTPVSNGETAADRFMFGTDWLMLCIVGPWKGYATGFQQTLLNGGVNQRDLDKLFFENAEKLFSGDSTTSCNNAPRTPS